MADEIREAPDALTRWLGLRWERADRVLLELRPELLNPVGLLAGPVTYAMVDYCMGSTLWRERSPDEAVATIGISINHVRSATRGEIACEARLERRNDRVAVLGAEVRDEQGRLLATAIGSFSIFPSKRLA
jgi:uncharacterized protein (TIGR00369 family)